MKRLHRLLNILSKGSLGLNPDLSLMSLELQFSHLSSVDYVYLVDSYEH